MTVDRTRGKRSAKGRERERVPPRPRVHAPGNKRLDGVLDFVAFATRPMPLLALLDEAPRRIASLLEADVCSLYVLEGDKSELVMRGNVGFGRGAIGQVRLKVGEGITGEAVEYMRPISTDSAEQHAAYKRFAQLDEERFPVFLAVPILSHARPLGGLVVQRKATAFSDADIELLTVLGGLIAAGIRHAELADEARERRIRRAGTGRRKVTLTGRPAIVGRALGAVAALRRPSVEPGERARSSDAAGDVRLLQRAMTVADKALRGLRERARALGLERDAQFLATYADILNDARFRERALEMARAGIGVAPALSRVAGEVNRTAASVTRDPFLQDRARDVEDLCDALTMLARADAPSQIRTRAILLGDTLTVYDALVTSRYSPAGIALSERAAGPRTRTLLHLMEIPAVADIKGLFRWATDGDIALLDGDHGLLTLNPSKGEIASLRETRRTSG
jgi:phosphotransferase system enzyme I (PtsP)